MSELILNGKNGFLVNSTGEAAASVENIKLIDRAFCREWAESKFSKEKMVEDYIAVYKKILSMRQA